MAKTPVISSCSCLERLRCWHAPEAILLSIEGWEQAGSREPQCGRGDDPLRQGQGQHPHLHRRSRFPPHEVLSGAGHSAIRGRDRRYFRFWGRCGCRGRSSHLLGQSFGSQLFQAAVPLYRFKSHRPPGSLQPNGKERDVLGPRQACRRYVHAREGPAGTAPGQEQGVYPGKVEANTG